VWLFYHTSFLFEKIFETPLDFWEKSLLQLLDFGSVRLPGPEPKRLWPKKEVEWTGEGREGYQHSLRGLTIYLPMGWGEHLNQEFS